MGRGGGVLNNPSVWAMIIGALLAIVGHFVNSQGLFTLGAIVLVGGIVLSFTFTVTRRR